MGKSGQLGGWDSQEVLRVWRSGKLGGLESLVW